MAESDKNSRRELDIALNPIGSLAFRERLESNRDELIAAFNVLSSNVVTLTLSLSGYRIVECFLNANIDDINVRLADSLSAEWEGLEKVLRDVNGRLVCETLLSRGLKAFAQRLITITPKNWWFSQTGLPSLPILIKAIHISEIEVANEFCSHEQMEENLCDSPEGLYCVLKLKRKSMNQPGWKEALKKLILLKARSIAGSEALVHVIVYGDYFVLEIVEMICSRRESYDDSSTVSLIMRLIESGSTDLRQRIFHFLCTPHDNPLICRIRSSTRFDDFKRTCDSHFTPAQRGRLDEFLSGNREGSKVGECLKIVSSHDTPTEAMDTVVAEEQSNKRRIEPITEIDSVVKKPRKEVIEAVPIVDFSDGTSNEVTVSMPDGPSVNSNSVTPGTESTARASCFFPRVDVTSMTINEKSGDLLSQLVSGSSDIRSAIFECIQNGILGLMMDERTFEIVKWFIVHGDSTQKDTVELRVMENVDRLVKSGACGRLIVRTAIDECVDNERKKELNEKFEKAMKCPRSFPSFDHGTKSKKNEIVIANLVRSADKTTVSKNKRQRGISKDAISAEELANGFNEIVRKLKNDSANVVEFEEFSNRIAASCNNKRNAKRGVLNDLFKSNLSILAESKNGLIFLKTLVSQDPFRTMITPLIASILHLLSGDEGGELLEFMLSGSRQDSFIDSCLVRDENSYFLKLFHADIGTNECVSIGITVIKRISGSNKCRLRNFITRFLPSIVNTENGRAFILARSHAEERNWFQSYKFLPPSSIPPLVHEEGESESRLKQVEITKVSPSTGYQIDAREAVEESNREMHMATEVSSVTSHEDTVATPVETTPSQMAPPLSTHVPSPLNLMGNGFWFRKTR